MREWLVDLGHEVADLGTDGDDFVDYPDYGYKLAEHLAAGTPSAASRCAAAGIGIAIAVNRNPAVRCALVSRAALGRASPATHNDANVIALGARLIGIDMAKACVEAFLGTEFAGGRHTRRVEKLSKIRRTPDR